MVEGNLKLVCYSFELKLQSWVCSEGNIILNSIQTYELNKKNVFHDVKDKKDN